MNINPVSASFLDQLSESAAASKPRETVFESFSDFLNNAMDTASEMDAADKASTLELLSGQAEDLSKLMLDAQKAEITLNLAIQLRNKVLDAYKEIMNMQV
ncbi:MAG: flagellar hook-basal body complex protein FliE [Clostridiales bacterium]|nr:flagellar hook-basal body complex protein FliE [Clostridiales bacterium]